MSSSFRPGFVPKTIGDFLDEVSGIADAPEKKSKIDDFVNRLEVEVKKIDAFERELPLCRLLLNDAISALKESLRCESAKDQPLLLEFIPGKRDFDESDDSDSDKGKPLRCESAKDQPLLVEFIPGKREFDESDDSDSDKRNWMKSVRLWYSDDTVEYVTKAENKLQRNETGSRLAAADILPSRTNWRERKRLMPFKASSLGPDREGGREPEEEEQPIEELPLLTSDIMYRTEKSSSSVISITSENEESSPWPVKQNRQLGRKKRRCWSAKLHEQFVNALRKLGGEQVATPKQIRELMQVDGLTNDEIKSHLQKYRLHTRRLPRTNQSLSSSHCGSPQGPLQLAATAKTSIGGGESFGEDEDTKSDSLSWKTQFHRT